MFARFADRVQQSSECHVLHVGKVRLRELDAVDNLEIVRTQDHHFVAELIEIFAIRRDFKAAASSPATVGILVLFGNIDRLYDLLFRQIDHRVLGLPDLIAVVQLIHFGCDGIKNLAGRIRDAAVEAVAFSRRVEHEVIGHFVSSYIDYFDTTVIVGYDVDRLAILRETHAGRKTCVQVNSIDYLPLSLIEDDEGIGIRTHKQLGSLRQRGNKHQKQQYGR